MTNQEKLDMDIAAARLMNLKPITVYNEVIIEGDMFFNIFTNNEQCLQVVKKLGEEINVYLYPVEKKGWRAIDYCENPLTNIFDTYEQAVGAACLEVMK